MAFEVASVCLKAGAQRFGVSGPVIPQQIAQPSIQPTQPVVQSCPVISTSIQEQQPPTFVAPQVQPVVQPTHIDMPQVVNGEPTAPVVPATPKTPPPSDWLKPKIFKSSSSIE